MTGTEKNASHAEVIQVLREWALAIRRDWGTIDGRCSKNQLDTIAGFLEHAHEQGHAGAPLSVIRRHAGVCPHGGGHWDDNDRCYARGCGR